jgi:hypothetical protein
MDWLNLTLNITFASIAILLCVLGTITLKTIKHLNVGKSFWIPVMLSGILFLVGPITAIFNEVGLSLTNTVQIGQITQLAALCFLSGGVYGYSRRIRKNLSEKMTVPETSSTQDDRMEAPIPPTLPVDKKPIPSKKITNANASRCKHKLGYLRTFPTNAVLPEECLSCKKILDCKSS